MTHLDPTLFVTAFNAWDRYDHSRHHPSIA